VPPTLPPPSGRPTLAHHRPPVGPIPDSRTSKSQSRSRSRSAPCPKKKPRLPKKTGPELDSMRPLKSPVSPSAPTRPIAFGSAPCLISRHSHPRHDPCQAAAPPRMVMNSRRFIDHLVGAGEQRRRHDEAERLGRRKIDHELEFGRKLYRQIAGLGAFQDLDHGLHGGNTFARVIIPHGTSGTNSRR